MCTRTLLFAIIIVFLGASCKEVSKEKPLSQHIRESTDKGIKDWGNFPIGGAINVRKALKDRKLDSITVQNFNSITSTNDMKMYAIVKEDSIPDFTRVDSLVSYTKKNGMRLFGRALVWHYGLPKWISKTTEEKGAAWADTFLRKYIDTVVPRYKDDVVAWDVVNEAFDTKTGAYRKTFWYETFGKEYIEKAFRYAHAADPDAKLFYNDFGQEKYPEKLDSIIAMVYDFKNRGVPIRGIGLQMHLEMDTPEQAIADALKKSAATGLLVHISELDIIFNKHNDENDGGEQAITELTEEMKLAQAEKFKQVALLYRKHVPKAQRFGITFWDFNDRDTWIKPFFDLKEWPTNYDENLDPKPAYYGFIEGLVTKIEN
ncbi:endo-1,4-beta-xylanase [Maribacter halichondriae]|uniref:endo-1,4-beta-xylanase n=1 Tax=Maribacter halichondriae TaxID=2980554 RepID=UPI00235955F8|nr:endo-1,4-beta-xylanase [Maribacter sp. Hal144]